MADGDNRSMSRRRFATEFLLEWIPWSPVYLLTMGVIASVGIFLARGTGLPTAFRWIFAVGFSLPTLLFCYSERDPFNRQTKKLVTAVCLAAAMMAFAYWR
jgi:hypothetical protein